MHLVPRSIRRRASASLTSSPRVGAVDRQILGADEPFLLVSRSELCSGAARTVLARWRWVLSGGPARLVIVVGVAVSRTTAPSCGFWLVGRPPKIRVRTCRLSGSSRPTLDRHAESTSADRGRRTMMCGDGGWAEACCCKGLRQCGAPQRGGVGRIHTDHTDTAPARHRGQPGAESGGGDAGHGTGQPLATMAAAQGFRARSPGRRRSRGFPPRPRCGGGVRPDPATR